MTLLVTARYEYSYRARSKKRKASRPNLRVPDAATQSVTKRASVNKVDDVAQGRIVILPC